jgi:methionyl-tRNA formyltransferase
MKKTLQDLRIVFMGTPEFAVASLDALVKAGCNIVGVITAPDKPAGRGMQLQQSAVKQYAVAHNLHVLQPEKLKNLIFIDELKALQADIQVVVAFRMLPEIVWNMPPMGSLNVHGSLLPQYRGAAPINWAVINGEKETGVTTFKLKHEIDTGNILLQRKFAIGENDTASQVHDTMKEIGAATLVETLQGLVDGTITEQPQIVTENTQHAPKIFTDTCKINFSKPAQAVHNLIRGLSSFPGAFCELEGKVFKIYSSKIEESNSSNKTAGSFETDGKTYLHFICGQNKIAALEVQLQGKKRMAIQDFLRGYKFIIPPTIIQ